MNIRLTLLEWMEVVGEDGTSVGRLMDLRARAARGPIGRPDTLDADMLLVGAGGWLEAMGLRQGGAREVPVTSLVAIASGKLVVRASPRATRERRKLRRKR
jgi:hypothetical protein